MYVCVYLCTSALGVCLCLASAIHVCSMREACVSMMESPA